METDIKQKIKKVREFIEKEFEYEDWKYHILPVVKYTKQLAKIYKVDEDVAELAALCHDIGRIDIKNEEEHHIVGVGEAEKILKELGFREEVIETVKHCVESHRGGKGPTPKTMTARIVANADAISHFDMLPLFFYWRADRYSFDDIVDWVDKKLKDNLELKMDLPEAKELVLEKHKAIKIILNSIKNS